MSRGGSTLLYEPRRFRVLSGVLEHKSASRPPVSEQIGKWRSGRGRRIATGDVTGWHGEEGWAGVGWGGRAGGGRRPGGRRAAAAPAPPPSPLHPPTRLGPAPVLALLPRRRPRQSAFAENRWSSRAVCARRPGPCSLARAARPVQPGPSSPARADPPFEPGGRAGVRQAGGRVQSADCRRDRRADAAGGMRRLGPGRSEAGPAYSDSLCEPAGHLF